MAENRHTKLIQNLNRTSVVPKLKKTLIHIRKLAGEGCSCISQGSGMSEELEWELYDIFESGLFAFPIWDHSSARKIVHYLLGRGVLGEEIADAIEDSTYDLDIWLNRGGKHMVGEWIIAWINECREEYDAEKLQEQLEMEEAYLRGDSTDDSDDDDDDYSDSEVRQLTEVEEGEDIDDLKDDQRSNKDRTNICDTDLNTTAKTNVTKDTVTGLSQPIEGDHNDNINDDLTCEDSELDSGAFSGEHSGEMEDYGTISLPPPPRKASWRTQNDGDSDDDDNCDYDDDNDNTDLTEGENDGLKSDSEDEDDRNEHPPKNALHGVVSNGEEQTKREQKADFKSGEIRKSGEVYKSGEICEVPQMEATTGTGEQSTARAKSTASTTGERTGSTTTEMQEMQRPEIVEEVESTANTAINTTRNTAINNTATNGRTTTTATPPGISSENYSLTVTDKRTTSSNPIIPDLRGFIQSRAGSDGRTKDIATSSTNYTNTKNIPSINGINGINGVIKSINGSSINSAKSTIKAYKSTNGITQNGFSKHLKPKLIPIQCSVVPPPGSPGFMSHLEKTGLPICPNCTCKLAHISVDNNDNNCIDLYLTQSPAMEITINTLDKDGPGFIFILTDCLTQCLPWNQSCRYKVTSSRQPEKHIQKFTKQNIDIEIIWQIRVQHHILAVREVHTYLQTFKMHTNWYNCPLKVIVETVSKVAKRFKEE